MFREWPVDNAADDKRPPDKDRLKQQARPMISPTRGLAANSDIVDDRNTISSLAKR